MYNNQLIVDTMHDKRMTIPELCERSGLSHETIGRIRKGENVSVANLKKIADALGIPFAKLFKVKAA